VESFLEQLQAFWDELRPEEGQPLATRPSPTGSPMADAAMGLRWSLAVRRVPRAYSEL
jgi:hypothetical protein